MDKLLDNLRSGTVDSQGTFTVDLGALEEKLETHQFKLPGFALLKLIQAAGTGRPHEVRIRLSRSELTLEADLHTLPGELSALEELLDQPLKTHPTRFTEHLAWGWAALRGERPRRAFLSLWGGGAGRNALMEGPEWSTRWEAFESQRPVPGFRIQIARATVGGLTGLLHGLRSRATVEHGVLLDRCSCAPFPVKLDGRLINNPERHLTAGLGTTPLPMPPAYLLVERVLFNPGDEARIAVPDPGCCRMTADDFVLDDLPLEVHGPGRCFTKEWRHLHGGRAFPASAFRRGEGFALDHRGVWKLNPATLTHSSWKEPRRGQELPLARAVLFLRAGLTGPGYLILVQDGVAVGSHEVDLGCPGMLAIAAADGWPTDLSRLRVREGQELSDLLALLRLHVQGMLINLRRSISAFEKLDARLSVALDRQIQALIPETFSRPG